MTKTILEQALDHLLNKEDDKASALLHDYYVGIGRKVYEDIMADDVDFEDEDEIEPEFTDNGDAAPEPELDDEATDDLSDDLGAEEAAPVDTDAADVADAMMDVESALAQLKAEFEEMVSGTDDQEFPDHEAQDVVATDDEEFEPGKLGESAELVAVSKPDNSDHADATVSPVAKRNPMMARPATNFAGGAAEGVPSGTSPAKAPTAQDMGGTTVPAMAKVALPSVAESRKTSPVLRRK